MTTIRRTAAPFTLSALAAALLSGCVVGPDYRASDAPKVERVSGTPLPALTAATPVKGGEAQKLVEGGVLPARWWTLFGSTALDGWVDEAIANSPSLDAAEATLTQAQAIYRAETGNLYPSVSAGAGASRNKISGAAAGGGFPGSIFNLYDVSVSVSYGLDLWGGTRRGLEGQAALVQAEQRQTQAAYLTLAGNVVTSAVALASADAQLKTARDIVAAYTDTVRLSERRFEIGAGSRSDVIAVQSAAAAAEANVPPLELQRANAANRLATLLGRYPSEFDAGGFTLDALKLPTEIPVALPGELVRRRPDIAFAEAQLAVASANVGIASANRFPSLVLTAQLGTQAGKPSGLFESDVWSIGANLTAPLFDGGRLSALQQAARARYEVAEANYRLAVLEAFRDVADALAAIEIDSRGLAAQHSSYQLALENADLVEKRFKAGAANVFEVRQARLEAGVAQIGFVQALAKRYANTAALFQALGGEGWAAPAATDTPAAAP